MSFERFFIVPSILPHPQNTLFKCWLRLLNYLPFLPIPQLLIQSLPSIPQHSFFECRFCFRLLNSLPLVSIPQLLLFSYSTPILQVPPQSPQLSCSFINSSVINSSNVPVVSSVVMQVKKLKKQCVSVTSSPFLQLLHLFFNSFTILAISSPFLQFVHCFFNFFITS